MFVFGRGCGRVSLRTLKLLKGRRGTPTGGSATRITENTADARPGPSVKDLKGLRKTMMAN
jgi:hypothetical protein